MVATSQKPIERPPPEPEWGEDGTPLTPQELEYLERLSDLIFDPAQHGYTDTAVSEETDPSRE